MQTSKNTSTSRGIEKANHDAIDANIRARADARVKEDIKTQAYVRARIRALLLIAENDAAVGPEAKSGRP